RPSQLTLPSPTLTGRRGQRLFDGVPGSQGDMRLVFSRGWLRGSGARGVAGAASCYAVRKPHTERRAPMHRLRSTLTATTVLALAACSPMTRMPLPTIERTIREDR